MQQVEIQMVGSEPPQARLAGKGQLLERGIVRVGFANEEDLVPSPAS